MFTKILFPTDFSKCADKVIPHFKTLKDAGAKEVVILHVIDNRHKDWRESLYWITEAAKQELEIDFVQSIKDETQKKLDSIKGEIDKDLKVKILIEHGNPFRTIIDVANKEKVTVIVMASHGASDLEEMLLGSVTDKVVRKSKQPCLVIKR